MTLVIPEKPVKAKRKNPKRTLFFGQQKIGKTTQIAQLDDCIILDTEKGTDYIDSRKVEINSLEDLREFVNQIRQWENKPRYIALDTIDSLEVWSESLVIERHNAAAKEGDKVNSHGDIPYGSGHSQVRDQVLRVLRTLETLCDALIIIAHRKKTIIGTDKIDYTSNDLDLPGKLKGMLSGWVDAVGYMYRDPENNKLMVSFKPQNDIEAGTRAPHLTGQRFEFSWDKIYIE